MNTDVHQSSLRESFVLVRIPSGKYKQTKIIIIKSKIEALSFGSIWESFSMLYVTVRGFFNKCKHVGSRNILAIIRSLLAQTHDLIIQTHKCTYSENSPRGSAARCTMRKEPPFALIM